MSFIDKIKIPKLQRTRMKSLSHTFDFNSRIGDLIPHLALECVAGDIVKVGVESTIQFPSLFKPLFSDGFNAEFFYFFIPYRILWKSWEKFLPVYYEYDSSGQQVTPVLPILRGATSTTSQIGDDATFDSCSTRELDYLGNILLENEKFSLSDYLQAVNPGASITSNDPQYRPIDLHHRAYLALYEYFFRDENIDKHVWNFETQRPVIVSKDTSTNLEITAGIQSIAWKKDLFTGVLPWIQKGVAPALPIYGAAELYSDSVYVPIDDSSLEYDAYLGQSTSGTPQNFYLQVQPDGTPISDTSKIYENPLKVHADVNLENATSADITELWTSMQIQKFLIRNANTGTRYNEFLLAQYGIAPRDETLNRPEFLGSTKQPVFVSEVVQTSESNLTAQGNKAGKAVSVGADYICKYHVKEPGVLMGVCAIRPKALYTQGVEKFYYKNSPYDFYNRLFENLADVAVNNREIFHQGNSDDIGIFGYQPIFYDYKIKSNRVAGDLRDSLSMWHTGRIFSSLPHFNEAFIHQGYDSINRIFSTSSNNVRNCVWHVYNKLDMLRPMSYFNMVGARI